uniref:Uncharacterized protein n=1 Tax=Meloidogyne enterolobii TaxID=390850 RepID=A0A6V7TU02_MELEN|nr:unnamed protein product [Meloidogyne enterolobii]
MFLPFKLFYKRKEINFIFFEILYNLQWDLVTCQNFDLILIENFRP